MSHDNVLDGHILNVIQTQEVLEQIDLQNKLKERGYIIPQATLSRRLKKLKIAKVSGVYQVVDFSTPNLPIILNIQVSESAIIVLHTHPGNASSLALFLDKKYVSFSAKASDRSNILGTIAGDDTVMLIVRSKEKINEVLHALQEQFPYLIFED